MTREELQKKIELVEKEIEGLEALANIANLEGFEAIIAKLKEDMQGNIKNENWKALKQNKAEIEKMRSFTDFVEKQSELIEDKQEELEKLQEQLDNYQTNMFEEQEKESAKEATGIEVGNTELFIGDLLKTEDDPPKYFLVYQSKNDPGKFVLLQQGTEKELSLNARKNLNIIADSIPMGNIYENPELTSVWEESGKAEDVEQDLS